MNIIIMTFEQKKNNFLFNVFHSFNIRINQTPYKAHSFITVNIFSPSKYQSNIHILNLDKLIKKNILLYFLFPCIKIKGQGGKNYAPPPNPPNSGVNTLPDSRLVIVFNGGRLTWIILIK